jgi:hypothetical protein
MKMTRKDKQVTWHQLKAMNDEVCEKLRDSVNMLTSLNNRFCKDIKTEDQLVIKGYFDSYQDLATKVVDLSKEHKDSTGNFKSDAIKKADLEAIGDYKRIAVGYHDVVQDTAILSTDMVGHILGLAVDTDQVTIEETEVISAMLSDVTHRGMVALNNISKMGA